MNNDDELQIQQQQDSDYAYQQQVKREYSRKLLSKEDYASEQENIPRKYFLYQKQGSSFNLLPNISFKSREEGISYGRQHIRTEFVVLTAEEAIKANSRVQKQQQLSQKVAKIERTSQKLQSSGKRLASGFTRQTGNQKRVNPYTVAHPRADYGAHQQHGFKDTNIRYEKREQHSPSSRGIPPQEPGHFFLSNRERARGLGRKPNQGPQLK